MDAKSAGKPSNTSIEAISQPVSKPNKNGPEDRFQVNQDVLYDREFGGDTYVSAHLQRLQVSRFLCVFHFETVMGTYFEAVLPMFSKS